MPKLMIAFHGKPEIKEQYLARLRAHYAADEIVKGKYWEQGKGCAVGCTIHGSDHKRYESELGIPEVLAYLEDQLFERIPHRLAKEWPIKFLTAIPVGADLSEVWPKFAHWLLVDPVHGVIQYAQNKEVIQHIADLYEKHKSINTDQWINAALAARAALAALASARAADDADYAAAHDATATAASAASYPAYAAARAAHDAALAADDADYAAARATAAYAAYAAANAYVAANAADDRVFGYANAFTHQSQKLLELLQNA
jgi:hypothetical protein